MLQFIAKDDGLICSFTERLDTENCLKLEDELFGKVSGAKMPVVFDLGRIDYVSSMFLRICIRAFKECGGENFSLINMHPNIKKVFKISGLDKQITIK